MGASCSKDDVQAELGQEEGPAPATPGSGKSPKKPATGALSKLHADHKLKEMYDLGEKLGTGAFSIVRLCYEKATSKEFACKVMALPKVGEKVGANESSREDIMKEIDILCGLDHPNIIYLKEYFIENNKVYLITELLSGGELLDAVLSRGNYTEDDARLCFVQLLRGVAYLHKHSIVHRDLKLENLLLVSPENMTHIKIADFGLAKQTVSDAMTSVCGTPHYVAPEVIMETRKHAYGPAVDLWSAGIILYMLLGGYPPFYSENEMEMFQQIRTGDFSFDDDVWTAVSDDAKDLIRRLLVVDPTKRIGVDAALAHPWLAVAAKKMRIPLSGTQRNLKRRETADRKTLSALQLDLDGPA